MIIHDPENILPALSSAKKLTAYLGKVNPGLRCYLLQRKTEPVVSQFPTRQGSQDGSSTVKTPFGVTNQRRNLSTDPVEGVRLEILSDQTDPKKLRLLKYLCDNFKNQLYLTSGKEVLPIRHAYHIEDVNSIGIRFAGFVLSDGDIYSSDNLLKSDIVSTLWLIYHKSISGRQLNLDLIDTASNHLMLKEGSINLLYFDKQNNNLVHPSDIEGDWRQI
jgi:hypothetical protein